MIYFIAFLTVAILIGLYVIRILKVKEASKKTQKDEVWDRQLSDLLESIKKKK
jgi:hypothetical protein